MKVVITGDWHLEAGASLGEVDAALGNTRLADAKVILDRICAEECDVLVFLGDAARTAHPKPTAYRIAQQAIREGAASAVVLIVGNHDFTGEESTCVHVIAADLPRARVFDKPALTMPAGLQLGVLPWTPPSRLFGAAPHNPREMNRLVAEELVRVAQGLGAKLDRSKPSLLVGHWLLGGGKLQTGSEVVEAAEPVVDAHDLEGSGPWDAIVFGHNHVHQQVSATAYHCGPPMRGDFGERDVETGFMVIEWDGPAPDVRFVPVVDRKLVSVSLSAADALGDPRAAVQEAVDGAIVKVRFTCTESEKEALVADGSRLLRGIVDALLEAGAVKVIGPTLDVQRGEREQRSDLTVETDPHAALETWLQANPPDAELRPLVVTEAGRLMT